jgi:CspA family cold shock protein
VQRLSVETTQEGMPEELMSTAAAESLPEGMHCTGRVKWFDATRGFGFLVSDDCDGDILIHFSVLK